MDQYQYAGAVLTPKAAEIDAETCDDYTCDTAVVFEFLEEQFALKEGESYAFNNSSVKSLDLLLASIPVELDEQYYDWGFGGSLRFVLNISPEGQIAVDPKGNFFERMWNWIRDIFRF